MISTERVKSRRHFIKECVLYTMGEKCQCCGYDKYQGALELHHLNPEEKEFSLGSNANRGWELVEPELKKCILVCANCHREIHAGLIDNNTLSSSYNEEKAIEIRNQFKWRKPKTKQYYCSECGAPITKSSRGKCVNCAKKDQRVAIRPSRDELKQMIRIKTFVEIGKEFNVTDNAIRKWCKNYDLPYRVKDIKNYSDEEWEIL